MKLDIIAFPQAPNVKFAPRICWHYLFKDKLHDICPCRWPEADIFLLLSKLFFRYDCNIECCYKLINGKENNILLDIKQ